MSSKQDGRRVTSPRRTWEAYMRFFHGKLVTVLRPKGAAR